MNEVFKLLAKYNWKTKLSKCQFVSEKINYLGHEISNGKIFPLDRNLEKLKNMKRPTNTDEMISFLGVCGYYKKFIQGYEYIVHPLRKYTIGISKSKDKNDSKENLNQNKIENNSKLNIHNINPKNFDFSKDEEAESSYQKLLNLLTSKPILRLFDSKKNIIVKTDVSKYAWGAALVQTEDGIEHPVAFASGTLNSSQRNWPTWKREAYGVLRAIKKWSHYLLGVEFTVVTDHEANVYLLDQNRKHPPIINNWIIELSVYKYKVVHRPGKTLYIEDGLSRSPNLFLLNDEI